MTTSNSFSMCMYKCKDCEHIFAMKASTEEKQGTNRFTLCYVNSRPSCEKCGSVDVKRLGEKLINLPETSKL
ncbi:hypothetical protein [Maridesulfovibrio ferrireducens]|uniref:hypothetical protein n=1 Tax=Maridesulfovibrio ferrireducens TaxID=246191 RepID=UPI001A19D03E|nr:hypothetical protein [Maridesulfovibrio ferrireducens]MBI9109969.1 hypothetical protein [Maridesulfovibrio ferrireducens]